MSKKRKMILNDDNKTKSFKPHHNSLSNPRTIVSVLVIVVIAAIGVRLLLNSNAASPYIAIQASSGNIVAPATVASDPNASNTQYVKFNSSSTGGGGGGGGSMTAPSGYTSSQITLDDQFTGTSLNTNNWNTFYGPGTRWDDLGSLASPYSGGNGAGNDVAVYNPSQDTVNNGLTITAQRNNGAYSNLGYTWLSGVITSKSTMPTGGWYVQVKAQMPDTSQGMWPAIWALPGSSAQELDGYEGGWPGSSPNQQGHSDTFASGGEIQQVWSTPGGANLSNSYHIYGFKYIPGSGMTFYFDGTQVYHSSTNLSQQAYYLFIQLQVAGSSTGGWHTVTNSSTPTSSMKVAEVQIYN